MNKFQAICAFASALLLSACATTNRDYQPTFTQISDPPLNAVVVAEVGETMLRQGKYVETEAVFIPAEVRLGLLGAYKLQRGYYVKEGGNDKNEFFQPERSAEGGRVDVAALADPFKTVLIPRAGSKVCGVSILGGRVCENGVQFQRLQRPVLTADGFQRTLIYSGRVGNKVNISYREFSNSIARPAFNNEVEYDLGESSVIGYKGAEIEIIEATNRSIKYRVIRNFNSAEM